VDIENRGALPAEGFVELITPPSHWQALGPDGAPAVWPERQPALIEPYGKERFIFHLRGDGPLEWGVAKAALNGRVQLRRLRPLPPAQANEPEVEEQS
jgi:hypothetical protein